MKKDWYIKMKLIKQVSNSKMSVSLYEVDDKYMNLIVSDERETPTLPSKDLATALHLFDFFVEQMNKPNTRLN